MNIVFTSLFTCLLFGLLFLWGILEAFREAQKNLPEWGIGTTGVYALVLLSPLLMFSLLSLWFYKTLIVSILRLIIGLLVFLIFQKALWQMLSEISMPGFAYSGAFVILLVSLMAGGVVVASEVAFRLLDWWLSKI